MGTSFSAPSDKNRTLPVELVINIFSHLSVHDLVCCRLVNRSWNDTIDNSQCLQHQINTAVAGVVDNPSSTLSLLARRQALARRQVAWDTCQPQSTTSFKSQGYGNLLIAHKLERNEPMFRLNTLREQGECTIISLAVCDNNDLIAIGLVSPPTNKNGFYDPNQPDLHTFEVDLLSISCGGGAHPAAEKSTLHIKNTSGKENWEMRMKIHASILAVHFACISSWYTLPDSELWICDWKTGEKLACLKGITAFQFLSNTVMVLGTKRFPTAVLELFSIPILNGNAGRTPMTKILSLGLPSPDDGCRFARLDFYDPPIENVLIRDNCLFLNMTTDTKPFISTSSNEIVFATFNVQSSYGYDNISFVVHSSALLRLIPPHSHDNMENTILWESWGPTVTRWHEDTVCSQDPFACGQRCILKPQWMGIGSWELWDFNPYRVRRLGKNFKLESEKACLSVETEPSCARSRGIKAGVYSSLPFVKIVPKQWPDYNYMGLYDDRMTGSKYVAREQCRVIDHLYFG